MKAREGEKERGSVHACVHVYVFVYCVHACMYLCMYVCICLGLREKEKDRKDEMERRKNGDEGRERMRCSRTQGDRDAVALLYSEIVRSQGLAPLF